MDINVNGKTALVTGGGGGIGGAAALLFAENGAKKVWIVDIDDDKGTKMAEALRKYCAAEYRHVDVTSAEGVEKLFAEIDDLDILFNCAGITNTKNLMETDAALWNRILTVNTTSAFLFSQAAMRILERKGGRIINVSSLAAYVGGIRTNPAYAASKAGVIGLTRALAKYGAPHKVSVNAIAPGLADTDMTRAKDFVCSSDEVPLGYIAQPREVANLVLFLASEAGGYITGQCININGGMYFS